jgi:hypothetical protein
MFAKGKPIRHNSVAVDWPSLMFNALGLRATADVPVRTGLEDTGSTAAIKVTVGIGIFICEAYGIGDYITCSHFSDLLKEEAVGEMSVSVAEMGDWFPTLCFELTKQVATNSLSALRAMDNIVDKRARGGKPKTRRWKMKKVTKDDGDETWRHRYGKSHADIDHVPLKCWPVKFFVVQLD